MNIIRSEKFIKSDYVNNNNKFWYITEYDNYSVTVEYGRVGNTPQTKTKSFVDQNAATKFYNSKVKSKLRPGRKGEIAYKKLEVIENNSNIIDISTIAEKQIESDNQETIELIRYLSKVNIHNITSNTNITFNKDNGMFETPCGIVTQSAVDTARKLLDDISIYVKNKDFNNIKYGKLINDYLMLIPQNIGRKINLEKIFPDEQSIDKQSDILDSLTSSIQMVFSSTNENIEIEKIFNAKLELETNKSVIKRITDKYYKTRKHSHVCKHLKPKRIFRITINGMKDDFEKNGKQIGNIKELWHGTKDANLLSIIKGGLIIPPASASHCTGRMFGNGIYFADSSTKSLNYSYGYWSNSRSNKCFMFLADVALGKCYHPTSYGSSYIPYNKGYDSVWAKTKDTGLKNDEFIIPNVYQCNLKYLIEFE